MKGASERFMKANTVRIDNLLRLRYKSIPLVPVMVATTNNARKGPNLGSFLAPFYEQNPIAPILLRGRCEKI